ncbi:hypothetical protein EauM23_00019 [Exiguobacterium phage vB_EauM-23]|nr:hypothetical protein EauM23_00019 [Exiguobacterium phage vB_EauM-23]
MAQVKIQKGDKVLEVSERLYRVYYSGLGYKKAADGVTGVVDHNITVSMDNTKAEIVAELERRKVDHNPKSTKEELLRLLGVE